MKKIFVSMLLLIGLLSPALLGASASADTVFGNACESNPNSVICKQTKNSETKTNTFVRNLISTLLFALGIVAVIAIVVGGIRYTTSDGDSGKIKQAKDTILYAVVGLVVAMLAFAIVNFVLFRF